MKKYIHSITAIFGLFFVVLGFVSLLHQYNQSIATVTVQPSSHEADTRDIELRSEPIQIDVPSVGISLGVIPGYYDAVSQRWTSDESHAVYATMTAQPGSQHGTTFIYAHNRPDLFRPLFNIKNGDQVLIETNAGKTYRYRFTNSIDVTPSDTSILQATDESRLVLQTCSGRYFQNRRLFIFSFQGVA